MLEINILDLDRYYAENLRERLAAAFPGASVRCFAKPEELEAKPAAEEIKTVLLYTRDHYPDFRPEGNVICLFEDLPFDRMRLNKNAQSLPRLGPVKDITDALMKFREPEREEKGLLPLSTFLFHSWDSAALRTAADAVSGAGAAGVQSLVIELGPAVYFRENLAAASRDQPDASDLLLALSLNSLKAEDIGAYWEPWPYCRAAFRLRLPKRSDDWLFVSADIIRKTLELTENWAGQQFRAHWRLFLLACGLPFRLLRPAAAMSEEFTAGAAGPFGNQALWRRETAELAGLLPSGAVWKEVKADASENPLYERTAALRLEL